MVSPAAMFIESAADSLKDVPDWLRKDQVKELHSFGDARAEALGATGLSTDFQKGYELGVQVVRVMLMLNPAAVAAGVKI